MRLKGLERAFKRAAISMIERRMAKNQARRGERPDWRDRTYRVLFLRHDRIGDMILTTGILRAIAEAYPTIKLDVLASRTNAPVLAEEKYLNDVVVFDKHSLTSFPSSYFGLRSRGYDAVIDCMVTAPSLTTLLLMLASGARYRIGVAQRGNEFAYTLPVPPRETAEHIIDKLATLLTAFGLQPAGMDLHPRVRLTATEKEQGERVWTGDTTHQPRRLRFLVNVSAGRSHHAWPDDRFIAAIKAARDRVRAIDVAVISSPSERGRAARIAAESAARLVEDRGIRDAMAIVAAADLVFTPDTSIGHACNAFDVPYVVLHPRGNAAIWGPYRTRGRVVESLTEEVADIAVEAVLPSLETALDEVR